MNREDKLTGLEDLRRAIGRKRKTTHRGSRGQEQTPKIKPRGLWSFLSAGKQAKGPNPICQGCNQEIDRKNCARLLFRCTYETPFSKALRTKKLQVHSRKECIEKLEQPPELKGATKSVKEQLEEFLSKRLRQERELEGSYVPTVVQQTDIHSKVWNHRNCNELVSQKQPRRRRTWPPDGWYYYQKGEGPRSVRPCESCKGDIKEAQESRLYYVGSYDDGNKIRRSDFYIHCKGACLYHLNNPKQLREGRYYSDSSIARECTQKDDWEVEDEELRSAINIAKTSMQMDRAAMRELKKEEERGKKRRRTK